MTTTRCSIGVDVGRRADSSTREIPSVSGPGAVDRANATTGSDLSFRIIWHSIRWSE
jgi:hypothetical protein